MWAENHGVGLVLLTFTKFYHCAVEGTKIHVEKSVQNLLMDLMVCSCFINFMESILLCLIIQHNIFIVIFKRHIVSVETIIIRCSSAKY